MKYLLTLTLVFSLNAWSVPNSIIAIVNDNIITYDSIANQINKDTTKAQKLALVNQQIDIALQKEKIQELGIKPKPVIIDAMLVKIAERNNLTLAQLHSSDQFDEIVERTSQELSFKGLKEFVLQQGDITITQAEVDEALAKNPAGASHMLKQIKIEQITLNTADKKYATAQLIKEHITKISEQIKNGTSFSELAKQYSKDPVIEFIWLEKNKLPELFQQQLSNLGLNEVSTPFKIEQDWLIIRVIAEREVDTHILNIKAQLLQAKRNAFFQEWVKTLRTKETYIDIFEHKL
jgi:peptidyl-prolyl cis-trans isomerase SurA